MLKVYKSNEEAILPKFATEQSACFDISSCGRIFKIFAGKGGNGYRGSGGRGGNGYVAIAVYE